MTTMLRFALWLAATLGIAAFPAGSASAEVRIALVIGNANYVHAGQLANTVNDARAITALLKSAGFDSVDERLDVGVVEMKRAVRDFAVAAHKADIAVVYYSGHGIEVGGVNYLIPVDARLAGTFDVDDEAVVLDRLIAATQPAKRLSLIILDACRENPFVAQAGGGQQVTRGVASHLIGAQSTGSDSLIAYAAKVGSVSYDGLGSNSPFTTALAKYIAQPGLDIRIALGKVRDDVLEATGGLQEPYVYGSLGGGTVSLVPAEPARAASSNTNAGTAADYAMAERIGTAEAWKAFLAGHGSGFYVDLARAQLLKLTAGGGAPAADAVAPGGSATAKAITKTGPEPAGTSTPVATARPGEGCELDAARLAELRRSPSTEDVADFWSKMTCDALRPQVTRLMESLGLPQAAAAPRSPEPARTPMVAALPPCMRDGETLSRLRGAPDPIAISQFARTLACDELRPQLERLMESLGVKSSVTAAPQTRGVWPKSDGLAAIAPSPADLAAACAKEDADLARLRAAPKPDAVKLFARSMLCEALKPQVTRLLESLGY